MEIFGDEASGNCQKVRITADHLGLAYSWRAVDILAGDTADERFLAMAPMGQVPVVRFADGRVLAQSNAILRFLARGTPLLPEDGFVQAVIDQWMFWEQYSHEPNIAVCRFDMVYRGKPASARDPGRVQKGEAALDLMERHLTPRRFLVGEAVSVADIALLAYTRLAGEGGFDLSARPAMREWVAACEAALGLAPVADRPD